MKMMTIKSAFAVVLGICAMTGVFADEVQYITDATYDITGDTLTVSEGNGTLVVQTPSSVTNLKVCAGAALKIGIDEPFGNRHILHVYGTLDLNGHSVRAYRIVNDGDMANALRSFSGRIINTSNTEVTIDLSSALAAYYYGTFEEAPGKIHITSCQGKPFTITHPVSISSPLSTLTMTGSGRLQVLDRVNWVKIVLYPPADDTKPIRLGEISMTYKGAPVPVIGSSVTSGSSRLGNLFDKAANSYWAAESAGIQEIVISVFDLAAIDGYRITPYDGEDMDASNRPSGWDVYVKRVDPSGWILADSKRNYQWYSRQFSTSSTNILFSADSRPSCPFGENTAISLAAVENAFRASSTDPLTIGTLTGSGEVSIEDGSTFAPGDISEYTGSFSASARKTYLQGRLALSASRGGEEQRVSITNAQNLAVVNGSTEPVSVLLDDSRAQEHLFGKLADGESGSLGLVKRGSGERVIETEDASYTGSTAVHEGTLTVARKRSSVSARYIRICPTANSGNYDSDHPWTMNEFILLDADGNEVSWPSGTEAKRVGEGPGHSDEPSNLIDGNIETRALLKADTSKAWDYPPVLIDTITGVTFSSYKWYRATTDPNQYPYNRTPTKWIIEVSDTAQDDSWRVCDIGSHGYSSSDDPLRGPFALNGSAISSGSVFDTLDATLFAAGTVRDTHRKLKAQYIRFTVYETYKPDAGANSWGWQLTEISLHKDGRRIAWPTGSTASIKGSGAHAGHPTNLCNNVLSKGDGSALASDRMFARTIPSQVVLNAHEVLEFDSYSLTSTSPKDSQNHRLPITWQVEISIDGQSYHLVDTVSGYVPSDDVLTKSYQEVGPFPVIEKWPYLDTYASSSIGDRSPVSIAEGATLKLATDYEKFGPLSGQGTLKLELGAVGEINACAPATFSGSVTGDGVLAVTGADTQTFGAATLSGVGTLELNGGVIAGSASFGGNDVTVAFNGGATRAALSGIGTLTVTGPVKYTVPPDVLAGRDSKAFKVTLFSAASIPAASRALLEEGDMDPSVLSDMKGWVWKVSVTDTSVVLDAHVRGLVMIVR